MDLDHAMSTITGKRGVIGEIEDENEWRIRKTLRRFGLEDSHNAEEIYNVLLDHLKKSEVLLDTFLGDSGSGEFHRFQELWKLGVEWVASIKFRVFKTETLRETIEESTPPK